MEAAVDELEAWCLNYVNAFSAFDVEAISGFWAFPALILLGGRRLVFEDRGAFDRNTTGLLEFYERQNVASAERRLRAHFPMASGLASIRVADRMLDRDGAKVVAWEAAYVLNKTGGGWRAVVASADGEAEAWADRGTPLGR